MANALLTIALASVLLAGCDRFPLNHILDQDQANREERDQRRLRRMRAQIEALVGEARCESEADCRYIGLGAKPCGGPWEYLVYSVAQTDSARLAERVAAYNQFEAEMNQKYGYVSDCSLPLEPQVGCVEGRCVDLNRGTVGDGREEASGIAIQVVKGPIHPVEREGEENTAPVADAQIAVQRIDGDLFERATTDLTGHARVEVPEGAYRVAVEECPGAMGLPPEQEVKVRDGFFTELRFACDTGIR